MDKAPDKSRGENDGVSRRNILKLVASGSVALLAGLPALRALKTGLTDKTSEAHPAIERHESISESPTDIQSAQAVLAAFAYFVGFKGIVQGDSLDKKSAGVMVGLALGRTALLSAQGNAHLATEGRRERHEIIKGVINTALLVALADAATHEQTGVRADAEKVFHESADSVLSSPTWGKERPSLEASRADWLAYEKKLKQTTVDYVAEIMGFSGVMAPVATTFVSSAVTNQMKENVAHAVFELSVARAVCERKRGSHGVLDIATIYEEAKFNTERAINGPLGFTNLLVATAANAQGSLVLGGAPYIFTAGDNFSDPQQFATNTAVGACNALAAPVALSMLWLSSVGIISEGISPQQFVGRYIDTARAGIQAFRHKRSVAFAGGRAYKQGLVDAWQVSDDEREAQIGKALAAMPDAEIQFDIIDHLLAKGSVLKEYMNGLIRNVGQQRGESVYSAEALWRAFADGDQDQFKQLMRDRVAIAHEKDVATLAETLKTIHQGCEVSTNGRAVLQKTLETDAYDAGKRAAAASIEMVSNVTRDVSLEDFNNELDTILAAQGLTPGDMKQALAQYTRIKGKEDAVPNEDVSHANVLSHSAKEAALALLTQVPAVPSAVRMAEHIIPSAAGIALGARPTPEQLKAVSTMVIALVTGLSAIADNVAAFLFGKSVLLKFFEQAFGKEYMDSHPDLKRKLVATCITIAQNAGAITKLGSPTNFAQQKMIVNIDAAQPQGMAIDRVDLPIGETVKNGHALAWNGIVGALARYELHSLIDEAAIERERNQRSVARRSLMNIFRQV